MSPTEHLPTDLLIPAQPGGGVVGDVPPVGSGPGSIDYTQLNVITDASNPGTLAVTNASNTTPVVITTAAHGLVTGQTVTVAGVLGNLGANGTFPIIVLSPTTFSLTGSAGTGAYTPATGTVTLPVVITTAVKHGLVTGQTVIVQGVLGNLGANSTFAVIVLTPTTFSIGPVGTGAYTSGGFVIRAVPPAGQQFILVRRADTTCTVLWQDDSNVQVGPVITLAAGTFIVPGGVPVILPPSGLTGTDGFPIPGPAIQASQYKITNTSAFIDQYDVAFV
jgi:hypothetical protein